MPASQTEVRQKVFHTEMVMLAQQLGSRLTASVTTGTTDALSDRISTLAAVEAVKKTQQHQPTQDTATTMANRWVTQETWSAHDWIDVTMAAGSSVKLDQQQTKISRAFTAALGRVDDAVIMRAAGGAVATGETGSGSSSFDANFQIAISSHENDPQGGSGDVGLTTYKLETAAQLIGAQGGSIDGMLNVMLRFRQWSRLRADPRFSSNVYNEDKPLSRGPGYMGNWGQFRFFTFADALATVANTTLVAGGTDDYVYVYAPEAIEYLVLEGLVARMTEDSKHHYDIDVYARKTVGAGRIQDEKIVQIACDATLI